MCAVDDPDTVHAHACSILFFNILHTRLYNYYSSLQDSLQVYIQVYQEYTYVDDIYIELGLDPSSSMTVEGIYANISVELSFQLECK